MGLPPLANCATFGGFSPHPKKIPKGVEGMQNSLGNLLAGIEDSSGPRDHGFLLGHGSVQTTERQLGCKQLIRATVNDRLGIEPSP
jgi:hypothetical protein